ncbi:MAG: transketolase-like TK C-terminal-containing protein, partial [Candidatus Limnocylindrales bacterium]
DGNDLEAIGAAIEAARGDPRPSLIAVRTHIGFGSPNRQDSQKAHGQPLGPDEVKLTKQAYGWDPERTFYVPDEARAAFSAAIGRGQELVDEWRERMDRYAEAFPGEARELERRLDGALPDGWAEKLPAYETDAEPLATRNASQAAIQAAAAALPELFGGAADLSESNLTDVKGGGDFGPEESGRNLRFGVREHAMGGVANGIAYHRGFIPYVGTFLNFSDYMRGSVRLAALSRIRVIYVWTHDSVGLGEDGPTHQPIEHYAALRAMPNLWFVRPGDPNEAVSAWRLAIERRDGPVALAFTRQKLPVLEGTRDKAVEGLRRGGYVLLDAADESGGGARPDLILLATGSELHLAVEAHRQLGAEGIRSRVVSMPCWELFGEQSEDYRNEVLPPEATRRVSIEAGTSLGWDRWVGPEGAMIAIERFGASAPAADIFERFGFTADHLAEVARGVLTGRHKGVVTPQPDHVAPGEPGQGAPTL